MNRLSERKLCEVVGIPQAQRRALVARNILRPAGRAGCTIRDALELAAYQRLGELLLPREAVVAWEQLRVELGKRVPSRNLDLVFDKQTGEARLAFNAGEVRRLIGHGRPIQLIELGPRLREISEAFRRWSRSGASAETRRTRKGRARVSKSSS